MRFLRDSFAGYLKYYANASDDTVSVYVGNPLSETDIFCVWRQRQLR